MLRTHFSHRASRVIDLQHCRAARAGRYGNAERELERSVRCPRSVVRGSNATDYGSQRTTDFHFQPHIRPRRLPSRTGRPHQHAQRPARLGRQLQPAKRPAIEPFDARPTSPPPPASAAPAPPPTIRPARFADERQSAAPNQFPKPRPPADKKSAPDRSPPARPPPDTPRAHQANPASRPRTERQGPA